MARPRGVVPRTSMERMRFLRSAVGACLAVTSLAACADGRRAASPSGDADLAIRQVTVVDVEGGRLLPDRTVLIRGNRIDTVARAAEVRTTPGVRVVDGRGGFLIPGLWDMHVHVVSAAYFDLFVANGVTGIRDMGGGATAVTDGCESILVDSLVAWRSQVRAGDRLGPRVVLSGPVVSGTGWPTSLPARTTDAARAAVRTLRGRGVDFVKIYDGLSAEAYAAAADEARRAALPFGGHVPVETVGLPDALRAGQRSIEHIREPLLLCFTADRRELLRFFAEDGWSPADVAWGTAVHDRCPEAIRLLRERDAWLVPTLVVEASKVEVERDEFAADPRRRLLPLPVQGGFAEYRAAKLAQSAGERRSEHLWWRTQQHVVGRMSAEGARFLAGTDAACQGGLPGASLHRELELLVASGLTPADALRAATVAPARYLNATDSLGTVARGGLADLVLLDANPLDDIRNTSRIRAVVLDGRLLDRSALDRLVARTGAASRPP